MRIRKTAAADLERVMEIYACARRFMAEHGNPDQWGPTCWPPEALIRRDIAEGNGYVCENEAGKVIGTFFFVQGPDIEPTYREITDGKWLDGSPYGVVHRIASDGSEKGVGAFCLNWAYNRCGHLRIDTHGDNTVMQNLVRKLGFVRCGTIFVEEDDAPRLAYEKSAACAKIEIRRLLERQRERRPRMTEEDTVKFVFQGMLGVGHLVASPEAAAARLAEEYGRVPADDTEPLAEALSPDWFRLNLRPAKARGIPAEEIAGCVFASAGTGPLSFVRQDVYDFCMALEPGNERMRSAAEKVLDENWLPSHSDRYRDAYHPAYRVLRRNIGPGMRPELLPADPEAGI